MKATSNPSLDLNLRKEMTSVADSNADYDWGGEDNEPQGAGLRL